MSYEVRRPQLDDLTEITEIYNHYVRNTTFTFDIQEFTVDERRTWFELYGSSGRHQIFVAETAGRVMGYTTSSQLRTKAAYETSVETSVYVHPDAARQGIGQGLYFALFDALAGEDIHRAYAGITLPNPASIAFHKRFGFSSVGVFHEVGRKFGRFWNVEWFERPCQ